MEWDGDGLGERVGSMGLDGVCVCGGVGRVGWGWGDGMGWVWWMGVVGVVG